MHIDFYNPHRIRSDYASSPSGRIRRDSRRDAIKRKRIFLLDGLNSIH